MPFCYTRTILAVFLPAVHQRAPLWALLPPLRYFAIRQCYCSLINAICYSLPPTRLARPALWPFATFMLFL
ncbi:hypothetical protein EDB92DRAFT_1850042 [Lactarius akahatsu]|uniref:Uncharacterized protein n=1 Tax=Lactarius akahatsu TaxID=416441 RepID=A0AAD4QCB4_9AGAM|nr:hypothetical protein EDB92DRAFT_1850042 [Lactarius akahatsu]